jgi:hypothetical protein
MSQSQASDDKGLESLDKAAVEYCDKPRCATITRSDKTWHRMRAAFVAGAIWALENEPLSIEVQKGSKADNE